MDGPRADSVSGLPGNRSRTPLSSVRVTRAWRDVGEAKPLPHDRRLLRVMAVDDWKDAADSLAMLIRIWGHDVQVAYDGASALRLAHAYVPDVALLDIGLPVLDGFQLAEQMLRAIDLRDVLLVAVSGHADQASRTRAMAVGIGVYLVKPTEPSVIEGLLAGRKKLLGK